jgi:hypothetical protein
MNYTYHFANDNTVVELESTFFLYVSSIKLAKHAHCSATAASHATDYEREMAAIRIKNWLQINHPEFFI